MSWLTEIHAVARLDLAEIRRSRWLLLSGAIYALLTGLFVLVGMRESQLLGFTGLGRVTLSLCHALVIVLPLLALSATCHSVNRAQEDGSLELVLSLPIRRSAYFLAISLTRSLALLAPLLLLFLAMAAVSRFFLHQPVPVTLLTRSAAICSGLVLAFSGLGLAISTRVRNPSLALVTMLVVWVAAVALLDFGLIGLMLRWRLEPRLVFLLASLNPVEAARVALLAGFEPELSVLGPVGFFLSTRLGPAITLAAGTLGPLAVGVLAWTLGLRRFRRADLV